MAKLEATLAQLADEGFAVVSPASLPALVEQCHERGEDLPRYHLIASALECVDGAWEDFEDSAIPTAFADAMEATLKSHLPAVIETPDEDAANGRALDLIERLTEIRLEWAGWLDQMRAEKRRQSRESEGANDS